jgi:uncharacterized protein (DUF427 family)
MKPVPLPAWLDAAREHWRWRGADRPPFAIAPGPGQESVWDYPRPPALRAGEREVSVRWDGIEIARTRRAIRLLETAHPPSFYLPWADVDRRWFEAAGGGSVCEWKGPARYWSLVRDDARLERVAWSYPEPFAGAEAIAAHVAFYAHALDCRVDGDRVLAQPGGFYGGWITRELVGPFKGERGTEGW